MSKSVIKKRVEECANKMARIDVYGNLNLMPSEKTLVDKIRTDLGKLIAKLKQR
tara:strand:+ start:846 stop:1007 length:162 start_codon:yes stop_codon:yes gene_type:complete